jgi:uncharacterized membrane protein YciS (DUF1049 family)
MDLDYLAKRLYPRLPYGRRNYRLRALLAAISVGLVFAAIVAAVMWLASGIHK